MHLTILLESDDVVSVTHNLTTLHVSSFNAIKNGDRVLSFEVECT